MVVTNDQIPDEKDFALVNEILAGCTAQQGYQIGIASGLAWGRGMHVTRKFLEGARDCHVMREAAEFAARWVKRRTKR